MMLLSLSRMFMKFSIIIPTRNRLEFLKTAIASVISQDYTAWEIVISDNHSEEDVQGYISSLNEPRIQYARTDTCLSVTENWNRALNRSTGDYVIVLGDDDCLLRGSLTLLFQLVNKHQMPDLIFSNGIMYIYPGISADFPSGHLMTIGNWHLWGNSSPVLLDRIQVKKVLDDSLAFKLRFSYNMQVMTIHKSLIEKLKFDGQFFHSPYPDFYAITVLLEKADRILSCPYPLTLIGICPKSFGGSMFAKQEEKGMSNLHVDNEVNQYPELKKFVLPGRTLNTCWLYALRSAQKQLADSRLSINFQRYRKIQMVEFLSHLVATSDTSSKLIDFCRHLRIWEIFTYGPLLWLVWLLKCFFGANKSLAVINKIKNKINTHPGHISYQFNKEYSSPLQVLENITPLECHTHFKI
jgi:glycosyltransferase involved in cell wall biosynthesis